MGLVFLPTTGRNTLCFTCQTLILTHPSWGKKVSNLLSCLLLWCQWREQFLWLPSLKPFFWESKGMFSMPHVLAWPGLAEEGFSPRSGSFCALHPVPAATCSWGFLHPPPQGFQSSPMPGHFFASFFLAANIPLLLQFFFLQHIPLIIIFLSYSKANLFQSSVPPDLVNLQWFVGTLFIFVL